MFRRTLQTIVLAASMAAGVYAGGCSQREQYDLIPYVPSDAAGIHDAGPAIEPRELTDCGDAGVVDLLEDDENCGTCGNICDEGTTCYDAECRTPGYFDIPCGPEDWCPRKDMDCIELDEGRYCLERSRRGCEFHDACDQTPQEICIDDECVAQINICLDGYCSPFSDELCDGLDNDRNGIVDDLLPRTCYSGPAGTAGVGICRSGIELCVDGRWTECIGERLPVDEEHILLCDGRDNDCDGCADNTYGPDTGACLDPEPQEYDVVFIVDLSGSMHSSIRSVSAALLEFTQAFDGDPNILFGLVGHPFERSEPMSRMLELPLSDFSAFRRSLEGFIALSYSGSITASEQNYDAPYLVAEGAFPEIGFRPDARRVYINFTDEEGQSYPYPGWPIVDETRMCSSFRDDDIVAFVTLPYLFSDFDQCAFNFELRPMPSAMADEFRGLFTTVCKN